MASTFGSRMRSTSWALAKVTPPSVIIIATMCWRHRSGIELLSTMRRLSVGISTAMRAMLPLRTAGSSSSTVHRLQWRAEAPFLDCGVDHVKARAEFGDEFSGGRLVGKHGEYIFIAGERVFNTARSKRHHGRSHDAVARPHAAEIEGLLDVPAVAGPVTHSRRLLARIGERMPHLARLKAQHRGRRGVRGARPGQQGRAVRARSAGRPDHAGAVVHA